MRLPRLVLPRAKETMEVMKSENVCTPIKIPNNNTFWKKAQTTV